MKAKVLIDQFRTAFGDDASLPVGVSYSDTGTLQPESGEHCMMATLEKVRAGEIVSFSAETIKCPGGKLYSGFAPPFPNIGNFVSGKEHYKKSPEDVFASIASFGLRAAPAKYLTFTRIDLLDSLNDIEGVFIFATADILAGCWSWANYDVNQDDAVIANFAAGCASLVANMIRENRICGYRCFIGLLDISARPYMRPDEMAFVIPAVRLRTMMTNFPDTCLTGTKAWQKVKGRIVSINRDGRHTFQP